jgi:hypothetical protein
MKPISAAFVAVMLWCSAAWAEETPLYQPGHHFGLGVRLTAGGTWHMTTKVPDSDYDYWPGRDSGVMGTDAGLTASWEYLWGSGLAFGFAAAVQFRSAGTFLPYTEMGTEIQLDPRVRYYFNRGAHVRPYLQMAVGPSYADASDIVTDYTGDSESYDAPPTGGVRYGLAVNLSSSIGTLFLFDDAQVGLFVDLGVEGVFYWVETTHDIERHGHVRSLLATFGLVF